MLTIGFTNVFYTLWTISKPYRHYTSQYEWYWKVDATYIQNLSFDFEKAKEKAAERGEYVIDLEQRGEGSYSYSVSEVFDERPIDEFPFGKLVGQSISTSDDVWQLNRLFESSENKKVGIRRRVLARRRLIELNQLVRHTKIVDVEQYAYCSELYKNSSWGEPNCAYITSKLYNVKQVKHNYITIHEFNSIKRVEDRQKQSEKSGHFFENGEKVKLELKQVGIFSFDTNYGTTYIVTFEDVEGRIFKYKGANPPDNFEELTKISATIKHSEYNGVLETNLLRIKLI